MCAGRVGIGMNTGRILVQLQDPWVDFSAQCEWGDVAYTDHAYTAGVWGYWKSTGKVKLVISGWCHVTRGSVSGYDGHIHVMGMMAQDGSISDRGGL